MSEFMEIELALFGLKQINNNRSLQHTSTSTLTHSIPGHLASDNFIGDLLFDDGDCRLLSLVRIDHILICPLDERGESDGETPFFPQQCHHGLFPHKNGQNPTEARNQGLH